MSTNALVRCRISDITLPVLSLTGAEHISQPFCFTVSLNIDNAFVDIDTLPNQAAHLVFINEQGDQRDVTGVVQSLSLEYPTLILTIQPILHRARLAKNSRLFMHKSRREIINQVLAEIGYAPDQILWHCPGNDGAQAPNLLQANETHFDFVHRLLAELGCFYWFSSDGDSEQLNIADDFALTSYIPTLVTVEQLTKAAMAGTESPLVASTQLAKPSIQYSAVARPVVVHNDQAKTNTEHRVEQFEPPLSAAAKRIADQRSHNHQQAIAQQWRLTGTWPTLASGYSSTIPPMWRRDQGTDDMTVLSVEHQGECFSASAPELGLALTQTAILLRRDSGYQPSPSTLPDMPMAFPARIESPTSYAYLDSHGRYQLRTDISVDNTETLAHSAASPRVERMVPFANANQELATGWHFPLLDQSHVLITCLNGDPNTPCILGFLPQSRQEGPVTQANKQQLRIVTPGQNELTFDDELPNILLQTFDGQIKLELNGAEANPFITLACQYGLIKLTAGAFQRWQVQTNLIQKCGGSQIVKVSKNLTSHSDGTTHIQSAKQHRLTTKTNLTQHSEGDQSWQVKNGQMTVRCETGFTVTSNGDQQTKVSDGSYRVQSSDDITVTGTGSGDMIISNGTGGFKIDAMGNIKVFGNKVSIGGALSLNGQVAYVMGGANVPEAGAAVEPAEIEEIEALALENVEIEGEASRYERDANVYDENANEYLSIELVDNQKNPLCNVLCEITKADGQIIEVRSDDEGFINIQKDGFANSKIRVLGYKAEKNQ